MVELLAPARDLTCLKTAINYGADAVYCGLKELNMRFTVKNFNRDELKEGIKFAHENNKKVYLCTNTVVYENDLKKLNDIFDFANSSEVDAVIVSDLGAMELAKEYGLRIHASVQTNITNSLTAKFYSKFAKRIILSRELTLNQIKDIRNNLKNNNENDNGKYNNNYYNLELEGFIHGALCVALSGRCFLSSYLFNRNANCGDCLQPCRRKWKLINEHNDGTHELICEGKYLLSPKDICTIEHVPELMEALDSFKIEGRAKNADYVMRTTKTYRDAINSVIDGTYDEKIPYFKRELQKIYNREYDTGFYFRDLTTNHDFQHEKEGNLSPYTKIEIGTVVNFYKKPMVAEIKLIGDLKIGDNVLIIGNKTGCVEETISSIQINSNPKDIGQKGQNIGVKLNNIVRERDKVFILKEKEIVNKEN
ncbi:peptidase U32 [Methanococcus aeolicus Nankai-3]|uniref:Peptidase U32 n=1 Tax=Methanococcus aeolicus (strain ATCC BAA-1280 / DSM 17508 / OCM 812 / Nankai-3) TaxID=419665 RepID=A6UUI9_META3|nr:peptidase U32 family protein [Methanococcus aeolicus]ABR56161.1 peptidase U32 [Methanococcus aeolicus Nankai-3]